MPLKFYYHPSSPPSKAVWMLLEEMGIEHELCLVDLANGEHKKPEYMKVNPLSQVPAIVDGNFKLWESRAVLQYLASQYRSKNPKMYPDDPKTKATIDMILYSDGSAYEGKFLPYLNIGGVLAGQDVAHEKMDDVKSALKMYDTYLEGRKYFAGDSLTIADLSVFNSLFVLSYVEFKGWDEFPNIRNWFENQIKSLKSYDTCIQQPEDGFKALYQGALAKRNASQETM